MAKGTDEFNDALIKFAKDIDDAVKSYYKRGRINMAALVGVLESFKHHIIEASEKQQAEDRLTFRESKTPPDYVG